MTTTIKTVSDLSQITATTSADIIVLSQSDNGSVDLLGGADKLTLQGDSNDITLTSVETIKSGAGDDTITLTDDNTVNASLGNGDDTLIFSTNGGTVNVGGVETVLKPSPSRPPPAAR